MIFKEQWKKFRSHGII